MPFATFLLFNLKTLYPFFHQARPRIQKKSSFDHVFDFVWRGGPIAFREGSVPVFLREPNIQQKTGLPQTRLQNAILIHKKPRACMAANYDNHLKIQNVFLNLIVWVKRIFISPALK